MRIRRLHIVMLASVLAVGLAGARAEDDPAAHKAPGGNAAELPATLPDAAGVSGPVVATPDQKVPSAPDTSGKPSDAAVQDRGAAPAAPAQNAASPSNSSAADAEAAIEAPKLQLTTALQRRIARSLGRGKNAAPTTGEDRNHLGCVGRQCASRARGIARLSRRAYRAGRGPQGCQIRAVAGPHPGRESSNRVVVADIAL